VRKKYFYGYNIVGAGFIIQGICYGAMFTYGLFFKEFEAEFGWSRAMISGASSLSFFIGGVLGIPAGRLNDKLGPRALATGASVLFGLGYLLLSWLRSPWQLYLFYGLLVAVGYGAFDIITLSTVARWFVRRRGMMSGIVKTGTGSGQFVLPLFTAALIAACGWRNAYLVIGTVFILTLLVAAQVMRHNPRDMGLLPDNGTHVPLGDGAASRDAGVSLRAAFRTRQFWAINLAHFCSLFCILVIVVHVVPHAVDLGLAPATAAGVISAIGAMSMVGRMVMGTANDRIGGKRSLMISFTVLFCSLIWLQVADKAWMMFFFAVIYGFAHGGLFTVVSPTVAELFGTESHGLLYGIVLFSGNFAGSISPVLAGRIFDVTGTYRSVFLMLTVAAVIGFLLVTLLRPLSSNKD